MWEHLVIDLRYWEVEEKADERQVLDKYGKLGWKLVTVLPDHTAYFIRPLKQKANEVNDGS